MSICYDEIGNKNKISQLKCGHIFHQECISEWTKQCKEGNNCPVCRTVIENDIYSLTKNIKNTKKLNNQIVFCFNLRIFSSRIINRT